MGLAARRHLRRLSLYVLRVLPTTLGEGNHVHATGTIEMRNVINITRLKAEGANAITTCDDSRSQAEASEKVVAAFEMESARSQKEEDELKRLEEMKKNVSVEEKEIKRLTNGSKQLKEKVDADFKLKDMKKAYKELEMKGKGQMLYN
ncbi:structural maintenance of chromosome 4 [Vigna unguiculata]|uniref:Structural maintenance of chromosome 4 n=1 Tax=Vigna unguiculata TaxID=3917 RepID=A0A4D6MU59_VIGUN|nr:structural maintenance of chromosome 4 [Vigna unguiculata]